LCARATGNAGMGRGDPGLRFGGRPAGGWRRAGASGIVPRMSEVVRAISQSYDDYLALERETRTRYAWWQGHVYAMAGGTPVHAMLGAALVRELGNLSLACGCVVLSSDGKVRIEREDLSTYPDASVVCGPMERSEMDRNAITNPALIVEVLSEGTEGDDRGWKWEAYRALPSLRDYVIVSPWSKHIEVYSREGEHWVLREARAGESVPLTALSGRVAVDRVYAGIQPDARPERVAAQRDGRPAS